VTVTGLRGLYLTVAFASEPDRSAHDLLAALHRQLQFSIEQSIERRNSVMSRRKMAERLLEPDFTKFPELRKHTELVVARVDAFVKFLGLSAMEIENARILAIVHDVGMRLLDYDRLYRKRDLSHDEKELLQSHVIVGAALVEPFLGREVARAVLCHHERWDGGGYPNDLRGAQIPLLSRVLQICDVYESMTASDYQPAQPPEHALTVIARGAGIQFDPDLAGRFAEMMRPRT
jgi:HD-GYP domain-containing protein (c-di-GMP phosphodiesterase class II)